MRLLLTFLIIGCYLFSHASDDCIFDQSTQTDDFLSELKTKSCFYDWNNDSKTATLVLCDGDTLIIKRGGCYDYGVSAEIIMPNVGFDFEDLSSITKPILWLVDNLKSEFDHTKIQDAFLNGNYSLDENDQQMTFTFTDEDLVLNNYMLIISVKDESLKSIISWYMN